MKLKITSNPKISSGKYFNSRHRPVPLLLSLCYALFLFCTDGFSTAHSAAESRQRLTGKVTDIIQASGITYVEIITDSGMVWTAGPIESPPQKGDSVSFSTEMQMQNYHSKFLDRDFSTLYFIKQFNPDSQATTVKTATSTPAHTTESGKPGDPGSSAAVEIGGYLREAGLDGLNTKSVKLSSFRGKPLIINLWASYCAPCRAEMGSLERLAQKYGEEFTIIGISIDDYRDRAEGFIRDTGITFANYQDHKLVMEKMLGGKTIPLTVLIDAKGRIIHKVDGAREWDHPKIIRAIEKAFQLKLPQ